MQTQNLMNALFQVAGLGLQCLITTGLIWILMRLQHLNGTLPKLLAAAAIATAVARIPFAGPYLGLVVLLICLRQFTGEAILPGLVVTVVVVGALLLAAHLWLLPPLHPRLQALEEAWVLRLSQPGTPAAKDLPVTVVDLDTIPPPVIDPRDGVTVIRREPSVQGVVLKGVMISRQGQFVLVACGPRSGALKPGEHVTFDGPGGSVDVQCESVETNRVWLLVRGPKRLERVDLRFKSPLTAVSPAEPARTPAAP
jgi:hypothetical protein